MDNFLQIKQKFKVYYENLFEKSDLEKLIEKGESINLNLSKELDYLYD